MKKTLLLSVAALLLNGCASLSEPKLLAPLTKVTVVSVTSNPKLYYVGDQPPQTSLAEMAMTASSNDGKNVEVANRLLEKTEVFIARAEQRLAEVLSAAKGSTLIAKETLFGSSSYTSITDEKLLVTQMKPVGYKFLKAQDAALVGRIAQELGANGVITAQFLFQKMMAFGLAGTGTLGAQTTATLSAYDATGKLVFSKVYLGVSQTNTGIVGGVYDPSKYEPVVVESMQSALDKFAADLAAAR